MREATDTTLRYLKLLACLPRHPDRIGAKALQGRLERDNPEYSVSLRTMQRDLERLSGIFPISCIEQGRAKYWFWTEKDALTQIPDMGAPTALALRMAEEYLQAVLPPPTLELLRPYFKHARAVLADTRELRWWLRGFGDHVEVQSPAALRSEFKEQSRALHELYESDG